jgi:hypothetical protein
LMSLLWTAPANPSVALGINIKVRKDFSDGRTD